MADLLVLDLVSKGLVTDQIVVTVGYDIENLTDPTIKSKYHGEITKDQSISSRLSSTEYPLCKYF